MKPAHEPLQRRSGAKLLLVDERGRLAHVSRSRFVDLLRDDDVVVANDAATLPASLHGVHVPTGEAIEVRLAGRSSLAPEDMQTFSAVVFGAGDFHVPTEDRPLPPTLAPGDAIVLGPLTATIDAVLGHPRFVRLRFEGTADAIWAGLARHGRPIQYAHVPTPLALWDVWTPIASVPAAFEAPSASFVLDWRSIARLRARGIELATITLAAGISSTGDAELDRRLPLDEPYRIPASTASAIARARARGGRVVAIGTTVVRALEHAADRDGVVRAGDGLATERIGPLTRLRVVDALVSGTHEPGSSHYQLLRAFAPDSTLAAADAVLEADGYLTHEFGDSILIETAPRGVSFVSFEPSDLALACDAADRGPGRVVSYGGSENGRHAGDAADADLFDVFDVSLGAAAADRPTGCTGRSEPRDFGGASRRSLEGRIHRRRHQIHARDDRPPRAGGGDGRARAVAHQP